MAKHKGGGGKKKAARGGGGRGGKGKGRGRGGGGKRKRSRGLGEEEEGGAGPAQKGRGAGKGRSKQAAPVEPQGEEEEEVRPAAPVKPRRPGYGSLLNALGVVESEGEDDEDDGEDADGEDDEDEEEEEPHDGTGEPSKDAGAVDEAEAEDDAGGDEEGDEEQAAPGAAAAADGGEEAAEGGLDFYARFWEDPPQPLTGAGGAAAAPESAQRQHFAAPGLGRCEAQRRDVAGLRDLLRDAESAAAAWRQCRLAPGLRKAFEGYLAREQVEVGAQEGALFLFSHAYLDVAFPEHRHSNARAVRAAYALHVVDHVMKAVHEVLSNSAAANAARRRGGDDAGAAAPADMGFTRARVLILCPFRSACHEIVRLLIALSPSGSKQVVNLKRFEEEFGGDADEPGAEAGEDTTKADWHHLFGGNSDDRFRLGLAISKKGVRLYSPFDKSDILVCSPLGLRQITGAEGEKKREFDFLSSIEVCVIDRADVLRMQNWEHVQEVMKVVNSRPLGLKGIDISRLRPAFAEGKARAFRQTIVTSAGRGLDAEALFMDLPRATPTGVKAMPAVRTLADKLRPKGRRGRGGGNRFGLDDSDDEEAQEEEVPMQLLPGAAKEAAPLQSCRGLVRLADPPAGDPLRRCTAQGVARQFFLHVACGSLQEQHESLFQAFVAKYWKPLGSTLERLLVVANSYLSFLQLRKFFREEDASFASAFEYSKNQDLSRSRFRFFHGERRVLLVTERFLWYRRYRLKGADYVLFYGPPETPDIYEHVLGNVRTPSECNSMCLFTPHDGLALERIVGHERAKRMLVAPPDKVFVFS